MVTNMNATETIENTLHLYRVWSGFSDEGNGDRNEVLRLLSHDADKALQFAKSRLLKTSSRFWSVSASSVSLSIFSCAESILASWTMQCALMAARPCGSVSSASVEGGGPARSSPRRASAASTA